MSLNPQPETLAPGWKELARRREAVAAAALAQQRVPGLQSLDLTVVGL